MNIKNLFKKSELETPGPQEYIQPQNPNNKRKGETFHNWGLRICAITDGSNLVLKPFLHNVYLYIHREQIENEALQEEQHRNVQTQIEQEQNNIGVKNEQLNACKQKQEEKKGKIADLKAEKKGIKNKAYEVNKAAKMKFTLGLVILLPLTFYLFLFYSSTFYSAFFKDFGSSANVLNSMFDADALSNAMAAGVTELGFVLCAPIIFMGLGFSLHFFTIQKQRTKYLKMASILCITFIFDAILAYMIGKHLHEMAVIIGTASLNSVYGMSEAIGDINTWAVIFCGFIVYIIWGIVFDMTMSAYDQLDLNKINIKDIDEKIEMLKTEISKERQNEQSINNEINTCNNKIATLKGKLGHTVIIDKQAIHMEMTNFFTGWVAQMNVLSKNKEDLQDANEIFENTINTLLNDK